MKLNRKQLERKTSGINKTLDNIQGKTQKQINAIIRSTSKKLNELGLKTPGYAKSGASEKDTIRLLNRVKSAYEKRTTTIHRQEKRTTFTAQEKKQLSHLERVRSTKLKDIKEEVMSKTHDKRAAKYLLSGGFIGMENSSNIASLYLQNDVKLIDEYNPDAQTPAAFLKMVTASVNAMNLDTEHVTNEQFNSFIDNLVADGRVMTSLGRMFKEDYAALPLEKRLIFAEYFKKFIEIADSEKNKGTYSYNFNSNIERYLDRVTTNNIIIM